MSKIKFRLVEDINEYDNIITINVYIPINKIKEDLPSGNIEDKYDEQILEDWYDFAGTIEGIINNTCKVVNISLSRNENSLSEYIDFYAYDKDGNKKNYLIDLRLSDHPSTQGARQNRRRKVKQIDVNYILKSVIVNKNTFNSYDEAIFYIRNLIAGEVK